LKTLRQDAKKLTGTSGRYLLDTNIAIAYLNEEDAIRKRLTDITAFLPAIALGELYFGAYKSTQVTDNLIVIKNFIAINTVLACDAATAEIYGQIKQAF
jgi:tRNA(fMet)-specific endonuclease VapC